MFKVLFVDDEVSIRTMLLDFFENSYEVHTAEDASVALKKMEEHSFDLIVSDINMPGMSGPELLSEVRRKYPKTRTALITAYNIDDHIKHSRDYPICSIIPKTVPFNFAEMEKIVHGLLTGDIFDISRYLNSGGTVFGRYCIRSSAEAHEVRARIADELEEKFGSAGDIKLILDELLTNAIHHAPRNGDGTEKYPEFTSVELEPDEYIHMECGYDSEKYGVSVIDKHGRLTKDMVLHKLERQITGVGLLDDSGRGLHMSRLFADRMIINIERNKKTEVIVMNYFSGKYRGYKPLYINEL
ncbi:MAG: response regulator [Chitinispirillaceae bacterium]